MQENTTTSNISPPTSITSATTSNIGVITTNSITGTSISYNPNWYTPTTSPYPLTYDSLPYYLKEFNERSRLVNEEDLGYMELKHAANLYSCTILFIFKEFMEMKKTDKIIKLDHDVYEVFLKSFHDLRERNMYLEIELNKLRGEKFK